MAKTEKIDTPGLVWRKRADGHAVPIWVASDRDFRPRTLNLDFLTKGLGVDDALRVLSVRCQQLNMAMREAKQPSTGATFDGTIAGVLRVYEREPESPYQRLKRSSLKPYSAYLAVLERMIGTRRLGGVTGLDVRRWFTAWRAGSSGTDMLPRANMMVAVLKTAVRFGAEAGDAECMALWLVLRDMEFERPKPRTQAPTAAMIEAARAAAHTLGHPGAALGYALQFEAYIRQWDLIGAWLPLSDPRPSAVIHKGRKWVGPTWASIDERMILSYTPTKTERTTGQRVHVDLSLCPMVMQEIALVPAESRAGPLVVSRSGLPYVSQNYAYLWRQVRELAAIPTDIWNRDIRAGGVTEGGQAGARQEDSAKLAGHSSARTTAKVYDRDKLEASRRVAAARTAHRQTKP